LPLLIQGNVSKTSVDNVVAVLENSNRICQINLTCYTTSQIENVSAAMQEPFPELTALYLSFAIYSYINMVPVIPDTFLGGSAPRLQLLWLFGVPFPGLPKLLLSATNLAFLSLSDIPHSGYFSPEAMVTCLSMLTGLETLRFEFQSPQSCPDQESRRPPPPTRSVLPALTNFLFKGVNEYLEELVARINAPRCFVLSTTFFNDIDFYTPELIQFISRTLTFEAYDEAHLVFYRREALVRLQSQPGSSTSHRKVVEVKILCQAPDWQLSSLAQICTISLGLLSTMENLYVYEDHLAQLGWSDNIENAEWLELLLPFTAVKNLYLSKEFTPRLAPALQELTGGRTTEVLPTLENVFLEGFLPSEPAQEGIRQLVSARHLINRPVAISVWERLVRDRPSAQEVDN